MEFVGKSVKKEFKGFGVFEGVIESYDSSTGFFKIVYEDGDSEEADFAEVTRLMEFGGGEVIEEREKVVAKRVGRKPKRRRRNGFDPGKGSETENLVVDKNDLELKSNLVNLDGIEPGLGHDVVVNEKNNVSVSENLKDGVLDLNRGLDIDDGAENGGVRGCIDLNLSVDNVEFGEGVEKAKKERGFDLNLGFNDENVGGIDGSGDGGLCVGSSGDLPNGNVDTNHVSSGGTCEVRLEEGCPDVVAPSPCENGNSGRRKRRKVAKNLDSSAEPVLRRSARRAKALVLNESSTSRAVVADEANGLSISGVTDESEEKPSSLRLERVEETGVLPPKTELPPSSPDLNLDGISVSDVFCVYSCLRSFSTLLYLSPFELEDLVAALKSKVSNLLIDFIHVSILQTLRKHLEFLTNEGCESASTCLRNLNWDLLDVITWPIFMVEYLLIHGSGLKPGFALDRLNLFDGEYYKQPAEVKLELLRCLCDDVTEVEAIRSELGKRMTMADVAMEIDRTMSNGLSRKRRISSDAPGDSCLSDDVMEEVADGNSDECCLCKMDGNLICCDGCPAAYHSKCVGIVSSLLPEGDWYCPECMISRSSVGTKPQKLVRGAELLGKDPYGRLYFSCFDFLLVSDSSDAEASFNYYRKDDLSAVIQLLKSSEILYGSILSSISQHWVTALNGPKLDLDVKFDERQRSSSNIPGGCSNLLGTDTAKHSTETEYLRTSSEGSAEVLQANQLVPISPGSGSNIACQAVSTKSTSAAKQRKKNRSLAGRQRSLVKTKVEDAPQRQAGDDYMNHYSFARTAFSIVEELLRKPSDKVNMDKPMTEEEIISIQLKFILKKSSRVCWTTIQDPIAEKQKENCGWCYCCRFPVEGRDCLFNFMNRGPVAEGLKPEVDAVLSKKNKKGHLIDVICYILYMEERLRGLLLGPWLSPQYSELWRRSVLTASDVSSLKRPLLMLESNIRPLALSVDWWKHVDSVKAVGSATHFVASSRATSKNGISKRKGRFADSETKSLIASGGLGLFWWRGGKVSRSLFNWKVVPHSLALKAARKAGSFKIPGILYPDSSEHARRSKCVAWRASVETSTSLEQLALQVRELDSFVRWDDIENTHPHSILDKESLKSIRLFKKAIIRRKCVEGTHVKYLLDFGKRRCIPDVVVKHGIKLEVASDEKKKYWLDESYVPLHLLKSFEERKITRKAGKMNPSKVRKGGKVMKKPLRKKGFDYLFFRAEKADNYQCGHCNKNVPISEAVSCQHCNGYFHKRHVLKSSEAITARCTYTCHRCRAGKHVKINSTQGKGKRKLGKPRDAKNLKAESRGNSAIVKVKHSKKGKALAKGRQVLLGNKKKTQYHKQCLSHGDAIANVTDGITLRRSARNAKHMPLQPIILAGSKKRKRSKSRNVGSRKISKRSSWQKRRTEILHPFWINGLRLSKRPNDERVVQFKRRKLYIPLKLSAGNDDAPKCSLCSKQGFLLASMYICCENCGDWFHGDAFGLNKGNVGNLMGFKCHACREKSPPVCPFVAISEDTGTLLTETISEAVTQDAEGLPDDLVAPQKKDCTGELHLDEVSPELLVVQTVQHSGVKLDHHETPIRDTELRVENGLSASQEVNGLEGNAIESAVTQDAQGLPDDLVSHKKTDCVDEFHLDDISPGLLEVQAVQHSGGKLDQNETPILDAELRVENGSSASQEVNDPEGNIIESAVTQDAQGLPNDLVEKTDSADEFHPDNISPALLEVQTVQHSGGKLDQNETPILDAELRVENGPSSSQDVNGLEGSAIEFQNGDLKADVVTVSGDNSVLERNKNNPNESQFDHLTKQDATPEFVMDGINTKDSEISEGQLLAVPELISR